MMNSDNGGENGSYEGNSSVRNDKFSLLWSDQLLHLQIPLWGAADIPISDPALGANAPAPAPAPVLDSTVGPITMNPSSTTTASIHHGDHQLDPPCFPS
ncbi:UNVERIFIED_CONTAM: hypothetical protein Slati_1679200 [Sesamum latifolium]|uniref:Uncharacterized protein n=1 Tax=Sesamum latifolium TaxID=2727402 RepID=A0AAW2WVK0_9LAMI